MTSSADGPTPTLEEVHELLARAEDAWRMERHLTDEDLRRQMVDRSSAEKASIRASIGRGDVYVVAGNDRRRVHFHDCPSLRGQIDRDRAWSEWFSWDSETLRKMRLNGFEAPTMPKLLSRPAVEALTSYVVCQICSPTLDHAGKPRSARTTKLTSLAARHIGRTITSTAGAELGTILRIVTTIDAAGTAVAIETDTGRYTPSDFESIYVDPAVAEPSP